MRAKEYLQRKREFAASILLILHGIDFNRDGKRKKDDEDSLQFFKDGFYYTVRTWVYSEKGGVEVRLSRRTSENFNTRYHPVTSESCFVYLTDSFSSTLTKRDIVMDGYYIQYYQVFEAEPNRCLYCDISPGISQYRSGKFSTHVKTKAHKQNCKKAINELASISKLNTDVIQHIVSYL